MRTVLVTCVFTPEPVVTAQTSHQLATELVRRGHQVTVIAPLPSRPTGRYYPGYRLRVVQADRGFTGVEVYRCLGVPSPHSSMASRLVENLSFALSSLVALSRMPAPDVLYANSWPLVATGLTVRHCSQRHVPVFLNVQDLYPETLVVQGRLPAHSPLVRAMLAYDARTAQRCARINLISPTLAADYARARSVDPRKITTIPNWVSEDLVREDPVGSDKFRRQHGLTGDDFVVVYGGSISAASAVPDLVRAFNTLRGETGLRLVIAGSGSNLPACRRVAQGNPSIRFHSPYGLHENGAVLGAADVLVLPTAGREALVALPSKLLSYMQAGRPIIAVAPAESDLAAIVTQSDCGWVVEPGDPRALAESIRTARATPRQVLDRMGRAGREYCLRVFGASACLSRLVRELEQLAG